MNNKKILCIGNNTEDTDTRARTIAAAHKLKYCGLITEIIAVTAGCHQTSIYDMSYGDLIEVSAHFDEIIILDQNKDTFLDEHAFYQTISLGKQLKSEYNVTFLDSTYDNIIEDELRTNKSICILPFIQSVTIDGNMQLCCLSNTPISEFDTTIKFSDDSERNFVKQQMLAGNKLNQYCSTCYALEEKEIVSQRIFETIEWSKKLNLKNITEFAIIKDPVYYEIRASNKCNLMCRMCSPKHSSLIETENETIKFFDDIKYRFTGFDHINIHTMEKLCVVGGEPTIMPELYIFLEDCISKKQTELPIQVITNATVLPKKFKELIKHFSNFSFIISVDGFDSINQYIRWPTNWQKMVSNIDYLVDNGHKISLHSVLSIYNITSIHLVIEFFTNRYKTMPSFGVGMKEVAFKNNMLSPYIFPYADMVIQNLLKITDFGIYKNDMVLQSKIDSYLDYFTNKHTIDLKALAEFFDYNDKLDQSRGSKLVDYIPELEQCRQLL